MNKSFLMGVLFLSGAKLAHAGGYLTNTNQNVSFLRNPARDGAIGIDGAYTNPAGIGFLSNGWHLSLNVQSAFQTREIRSFFTLNTSQGSIAPFVLGKGNEPSGHKTFKGKAVAPVFPTADVAAVYGKWFFSAHLGVTGGGGKAKFKNGLGLFESQVALTPLLINALTGKQQAAGYAADSYVHGRQYYYGGQLNTGYRILPNLSVSAGLRVVYAYNNYYGYVKNISALIKGKNGMQRINASEWLRRNNMPHLARLTEDKELNCDQSGFGFTPVLGIDYKAGKWNLAAKYEFKTRLRLTNQSGKNTSGLEEFDDGKTLKADIPAILAAGAQYEIRPSLRANVAGHYYFDKEATQYDDRQKKLAGNGWEVLAGMEWDVNDKITVSAGLQNTNYGLGKNSEFINNISFVTNSTSIGFGAKFRILPKVSLNLAYFHTFYQHYEKQMEDYNGLTENFKEKIQGSILKNMASLTPEERDAVLRMLPAFVNAQTPGKDVFHRTNQVFGIGADIDF